MATTWLMTTCYNKTGSLILGPQAYLQLHCIATNISLLDSSLSQTPFSQDFCNLSYLEIQLTVPDFEHFLTWWKIKYHIYLTPVHIQNKFSVPDFVSIQS